MTATTNTTEKAAKVERAKNLGTSGLPETVPLQVIIVNDEDDSETPLGKPRDITQEKKLSAAGNVKFQHLISADRAWNGGTKSQPSAIAQTMDLIAEDSSIDSDQASKLMSEAVEATLNSIRFEVDGNRLKAGNVKPSGNNNPTVWHTGVVPLQATVMVGNQEMSNSIDYRFEVIITWIDRPARRRKDGSEIPSAMGFRVKVQTKVQNPLPSPAKSEPLDDDFGLFE